MDTENKWEYKYSSDDNQPAGNASYPNVGSSGMNTANTAGTFGEPAENFFQEPEPDAAAPNGSGGATPPPEPPVEHAAPEQPILAMVTEIRLKVPP